MTEIAWTTLWPSSLRPGGVCLVAGARGLLAVELLGRRESPGALSARIDRRWGAGLSRGESGRRASTWLSRALEELQAYFAGSREPFRVPCDPGRLEGSFSDLVWRALRRVPFGTVVSYGDLASMLGREGSARAVGGAVGRNPFPIVVPCHRVIGGDGRLTGFSAGLRQKVRLLHHEGIVAEGTGALRQRRVSWTRGNRSLAKGHL